MVLIGSVGFTACGGATETPPAEPTGSPTTGGEITGAFRGTPQPDRRCDRGRLTIGDLPAMDALRQDALQDATERARQWQEDAKLVALKVECAVLETDIRWAATYASVDAQSYFRGDTGETEPAETDVALLSTLPVEDVRFADLHAWLLDADPAFRDDSELSPVSGVAIRLNTAASPFGPPDAPRGAVYFHVGVIQDGITQDLFVSASTGTVYRYGA